MIVKEKCQSCMGKQCVRIWERPNTYLRVRVFQLVALVAHDPVPHQAVGVGNTGWHVLRAYDGASAASGDHLVCVVFVFRCAQRRVVVRDHAVRGE